MIISRSYNYKYTIKNVYLKIEILSNICPTNIQQEKIYNSLNSSLNAFCATTPFSIFVTKNAFLPGLMVYCSHKDGGIKKITTLSYMSYQYLRSHSVIALNLLHAENDIEKKTESMYRKNNASFYIWFNFCCIL